MAAVLNSIVELFLKTSLSNVFLLTNIVTLTYHFLQSKDVDVDN